MSHFSRTHFPTRFDSDKFIIVNRADCMCSLCTDWSAMELCNIMVHCGLHIICELFGSDATLAA